MIPRIVSSITNANIIIPNIICKAALEFGNSLGYLSEKKIFKKIKIKII
jgi:hypothetical protein